MSKEVPDTWLIVHVFTVFRERTVLEQMLYHEAGRAENDFPSCVTAALCDKPQLNEWMNSVLPKHGEMMLAVTFPRLCTLGFESKVKEWY